jgi:tetratricopeptide (TPR) repeat protein
MVEIYLEGLKPRIEKAWKDLGKTPKRRKTELVSEKELKATIEAAAQENEKIKSQEHTQEVSVKKVFGLNEEVSPDNILKLVNGTLVVKLKALVDEIKALKDSEFKQHVNEEKNDFSEWIRTSLNNDKFADIADNILTKEDYISFLEALDQGKEKQFKVTSIRPKPYSSKKVQKIPEQPKESKPLEEKPKDKPSIEGPQEEKPTEEKLPEQPREEKMMEKQPEKLSVEKRQEAHKEENKEQGITAEKNIIPEVRHTEVNWQEIKNNLATLPPSEKANYLKKAMETNPDDVNIMFSLAAEYHRMNDLFNAEIYYKKILEKNPDNPKVLYYLGSLYYGQKKFEEALDCFNKVIKIQPDYPKVKDYIASINRTKQEIKK